MYEGLIRIENFIIEINEKEIVSKLSPPISQEEISSIAMEARTLIKPAVIFKTYFNFHEVSEFADEKTKALTIFIGTIGKEIEEEIFISDNQKKEVLGLIAKQCCRKIVNFVRRIISDESKKDGYFIAGEEIFDSDKISKITDILEAEKIGIRGTPPYFVISGILRLGKKSGRFAKRFF